MSWRSAEQISASYVGRILRLTLLFPEIVEAILDGRQPAEMTLAMLMQPFALEQHAQSGYASGQHRGGGRSRLGYSPGAQLSVLDHELPQPFDAVPGEGGGRGVVGGLSSLPPFDFLECPASQYRLRNRVVH